jgi:hypothetical protein
MLDARVIPAQRTRRVLRALAGGSGSTLMLLLALLTGTGWLYVLRGLRLFALGPGVGDSLPLLQLAGFDGQPLARVAVAWLLAGALFGVVLIRVDPLPRAIVAGAVGVLLLLFASQAAYALAQNLRLSHVLWSRLPGFGPWLEGLLFAAGSALPRPLPGSQRLRPGAVQPNALARAHDLLLSLRQRRHARKHERDGEHVDDRGSHGSA